MDLPGCFGRWPPWHWGWAGQKQEEAGDSPWPCWRRGHLCPCTVPILCCCLLSSCWTSSPELGLCQRGGTHKCLLWNKNKVFPCGQAVTSHRAAARSRCAPCPGENDLLCGSGPAKGSDPSHWGHWWLSVHRGRGTLCPDASAAPLLETVGAVRGPAALPSLFLMVVGLGLCNWKLTKLVTL